MRERLKSKKICFISKFVGIFTNKQSQIAPNQNLNFEDQKPASKTNQQEILEKKNDINILPNIEQNKLNKQKLILYHHYFKDNDFIIVKKINLNIIKEKQIKIGLIIKKGYEIFLDICHLLM